MTVKQLFVVAAMIVSYKYCFKFYCKFYCNCDPSISAKVGGRRALQRCHDDSRPMSCLLLLLLVHLRRLFLTSLAHWILPSFEDRMPNIYLAGCSVACFMNINHGKDICYEHVYSHNCRYKIKTTNIQLKLPIYHCYTTAGV